jgi:hypothetical protein
MMQPEQGDSQVDNLRFTEGMPIQDYTRLLDKLITSATTIEEFGGVGLTDNTSISLPTNNPQETFDQIVADLENAEIFPGYEPAGSDYPTTDGENPRRIFFKNSQFVQLRSFKESAYDPGEVLFTTSHHNPPAGFTKNDLIEKNNPTTLTLGIFSAKIESMISTSV